MRDRDAAAESQDRYADQCAASNGLLLCSAYMEPDVHLASTLANWSAGSYVHWRRILRRKGGSLAADTLTLDQPRSAMAQQLMWSGTRSMIDGCFDPHRRGRVVCGSLARCE